MICKFQVGQKVVCVGDFAEAASKPWSLLLDLKFPEVGGVYTIKELRPGVNSEEEESVGVLLHEIDNPEVPTTTLGAVNIEEDRTKKQEPAFDSKAFEPLISAKTDISVFKSILTPSRVEEAA